MHRAIAALCHLPVLVPFKVHCLPPDDASKTKYLVSGAMMTDTTIPMTDPQQRELWPALAKGWRQKCPSCGKGALLHSYLKVNDSCDACDQELHHHQADDGPAYLTILIVGHIMAPALLIAFKMFRPDPLVLFVVFAVGCLALSLYLLPRLKGAVVGFQWAQRMHGFDDLTR